MNVGFSTAWNSSRPRVHHVRGREFAGVAGSQCERVAGDGDHAEPLLAADRRDRSAGVDARYHAVPLAGGDDRGEGIVEHWLAVVVARLEAEADRQVSRTDVDRVDAGDGEDLVEVGDRLSGLDHRDRRHMGVGPGAVVVVTHARHHRPPTARAIGHVARRAHDRLRLLPRVDHRDDDAVGAGVEHLADDAGLVPRHARDRRAAAQLDRLDHRRRLGVVVDPVLEVDADVVDRLARRDLRRHEARQRQPEAERLAPGCPFLTQTRHAGESARRLSPRPCWLVCPRERPVRCRSNARTAGVGRRRLPMRCAA